MFIFILLWCRTGPDKLCVKSQIVNILGFAGEKAKLRIICKYLYNIEKKFQQMFNGEIQNTIIIEHLFCNTELLKNNRILFLWDTILFH